MNMEPIFSMHAKCTDNIALIHWNCSTVNSSFIYFLACSRLMDTVDFECFPSLSLFHSNCTIPNLDKHILRLCDFQFVVAQPLHCYMFNTFWISTFSDDHVCLNNPCSFFRPPPLFFYFRHRFTFVCRVQVTTPQVAALFRICILGTTAWGSEPPPWQEMALLQKPCTSSCPTVRLTSILCLCSCLY